MKHKLLNIFTTVLLLAMSICSGYAQTSVDSTMVRTDFSIIRHFNGNQFVVYHKNGSQSSFSGWSLASPLNTFTFPSATNNVIVRDFEVLENRYVFFCGNEGNSAVVGYFDGYTLMGGTSTNFYYWQILNTGNFSYDSLCKIEVFRSSSDNSIHMVMVGRTTYLPQNIPCQCVMDARLPNLPPNGIQVTAMTYIKNHDQYYDIAVSDKYVFTADRLGQHPSGRFYDRPTNFTSTIFSTTLYSTSFYTQPSFLALSMYAPVVAHLQSDDFITVYPENSSNILMSLYNGTVYSSSVKIDISPYTVAGRVKDISVNYPDVYFTLDALNGSGNIESLIFHAVLPFSSLSVSCFKVSNIDQLHSVTALSSAGLNLCATGITPPYLSILKYTNTDTVTCTTSVPDTTSTYSNPITPGVYTMEVYNPNITPIINVNLTPVSNTTSVYCP